MENLLWIWNNELILWCQMTENIFKRMSAMKKAKQIAKYFRQERADYQYTKDVFRKLRCVLEIEVTKKTKKLPYVPTEDEIKKYYEQDFRTFYRMLKVIPSKF